VLATREIFLQPAESLEQFEARMHALEHVLLVDTLKALIFSSPGHSTP
jgi:folate-dependent phosphoribosylglycinamide formyltransferase PurN